MNLSSNSSLGGVVDFVIGIINSLIGVLTVLALVLFLYAGVRYVFKASEAKGKGPERDALLWGLISLLVLVSVWGLISIMCATLLGNPRCREGANSTGVDYYFGTGSYENNNSFGGAR